MIMVVNNYMTLLCKTFVTGQSSYPNSSLKINMELIKGVTSKRIYNIEYFLRSVKTNIKKCHSDLFQMS